MSMTFPRLRLVTLLALIAACDTGAELPRDSRQLEARVVWFYVDQISVEQGIDISELVGTRVIDDWNTPILITVGPNVDPVV